MNVAFHKIVGCTETTKPR